MARLSAQFLLAASQFGVKRVMPSVQVHEGSARWVKQDGTQVPEEHIPGYWDPLQHGKPSLQVSPGN